MIIWVQKSLKSRPRSRLSRGLSVQHVGKKETHCAQVASGSSSAFISLWSTWVRNARAEKSDVFRLSVVHEQRAAGLQQFFFHFFGKQPWLLQPLCTSIRILNVTWHNAWMQMIVAAPKMCCLFVSWGHSQRKIIIFLQPPAMQHSDNILSIYLSLTVTLSIISINPALFLEGTHFANLDKHLHVHYFVCMTAVIISASSPSLAFVE